MLSLWCSGRMMRTIIGNPEVAAIEVDVEDPRDEKWLLGHFRLHARSETIGEWDDVVTLGAIINWWRSFATDRVDRWEPRLEGLGANEIFDLLRDTAYTEDEEVASIMASSDIFVRYHVGHLGMSSFDPFVVFLVEPPGEDQWLLWRREDGRDDVHDARLPAGTLQDLGAQFVAAFRRLVTPRQP